MTCPLKLSDETFQTIRAVHTRQGGPQIARRLQMARPKPGARYARRQGQEDPAELSRRADQLREGAALKLSQSVLEGGGQCCVRPR
jgi:hypothetical protein